ncbi:MAG: HAD hydrolase family protein [Bacteroidetes bacterium]|nr:HAD hydrolase family protein [Bacteroidota bacterium]
MTHKQLSMMCGISIDSLKIIENTATEPTLSELVCVAEALNFPVDRLILENLEKNYYLLKGFEFKLLALDIDGVLTDAGIYNTESGDDLKKFNAKDGLAIKTLAAAGKYVGFISSGTNSKIIERRAEFLGVQKVCTDTWKKIEVLESWCRELNIGFENIAYIGDDINDLPSIRKVGLSACPSDAVNLVKEAVTVVLSKKGGEGCVREFVDKYIMEIR